MRKKSHLLRKTPEEIQEGIVAIVVLKLNNVASHWFDRNGIHLSIEEGQRLHADLLDAVKTVVGFAQPRQAAQAQARIERNLAKIDEVNAARRAELQPFDGYRAVRQQRERKAALEAELAKRKAGNVDDLV